MTETTETTTNRAVFALWICLKGKYWLFNTYEDEPFYDAKEICQKHKEGLERQGHRCKITEIQIPDAEEVPNEISEAN